VRIVNEYYRRGQAGKENAHGANRQASGVLAGLEKDHRNLVKHCLNMEQEIRNYTCEMQKYGEMKRHLLSVSHTDTGELIQELRCLTDENSTLKKENNRLAFELEKSRQEGARLRRGKEQWEEKADLEGGELERYKALVNTVQQESADRNAHYDAKVPLPAFRSTSSRSRSKNWKDSCAGNRNTSSRPTTPSEDSKWPQSNTSTNATASARASGRRNRNQGPCTPPALSADISCFFIIAVITNCMNPTFRTPDRQPVCHLAASPVDGLSSEYPTRQEES
jgi:hypothetical protein